MLEKFVTLCVTGLGTVAALDPFAKHDDDFSIALKIAIGALASAVVAMYGFFMSRYKRLERLLEAREKDGAKREHRIQVLERQTGIVRAVKECPSLDCGLREAARHFPELDGEGA